MSFRVSIDLAVATVRSIVRPKFTPPYDLFALYLIYTIFELVSRLHITIELTYRADKFIQHTHLLVTRGH
jgi:hypothetical protein